MKVVFQPELAERKALADIAKAATPILEQEIGSPAARVTATWGLGTDDHGHQLIQLRIADWSGQASADFEPEELQPPDHARRRFYRLWGDLLQNASQRLVQALETVGAEDQGP